MDTNSAEVIQKTPYALMGGEEPLRRLVKRFYEIVDSDPMAAPIRAMHKDDLGPIQEALFEFMSGWLGGPALYSERTGTICLTEPPAAFEIGEPERDQWMHCMRRALDETEVSDEVKATLEQPLLGLADFIRNV